MESSDAVDSSWSISVKTVGGGFDGTEDCNEPGSAAACAGGEKQFVVTVSPEDGLASLHDKIEGATGLKASQQRLIYRGRLIGQSDVASKNKIKDIDGLSNGQTIHLVKKRDSASDDSAGTSVAINSTNSSTSNNDRPSLESDLFGGSSGGGGSGSLLAALLGLSSLSDENNDDTGAARQRWGWRSSRMGRSSRRPHYRLTEEDLEVPDPGSMEPVRQGLMTLHTLLPHARLSDQQSPLEANREWYRGQWIDCRDTVNQWLEATVVEIVKADDILPPRCRPASSATSSRRRRSPSVDNDPAVSANDLEGRRRLLLEPCDLGDFDEEEGELVGFRRRANNDGVQLLLIHYNGWPHRWDEWIRSDSERIRPFRTRTRHPSVSSTACPTPQSVFSEAPRTNILLDGEEEEDRSALLPELSRAINNVNDLLTEVMQGQSSVVSVQTESEASNVSSDLPWVRPAPSRQSSNIVDFSDDEDDLIIDVPRFETKPQQFNRRQLQNLATLLDRLGRTLTDAAPHVASLAASLPEDQPPPLISRSTEMEEAIHNDLPEIDEGNHPSLGGLLSLWSRERRRQNPSQEDRNTDEGPIVDPDHVDYASGLVNTSRGEVRSGPRSRSSNDDVAGLLGAYLAAASLGSMSSSDDNDNDDENGATSGLGRLLRERGAGGGGGGIDIHIHAVVTAPGMGGGGLGLAALGGGTPTALATRNLFSATRDRSIRTPTTSSILRNSRQATSLLGPSSGDDEEDIGLFSELYSENPAPVDPNGSPQPGEAGASISDTSYIRDDPTADFLARLNSSANDGISGTRRNHRSSRRDSTDRRGSGWGRLFRRRARSRDL